ncbi:MAG: orotidine-5'-phosphate decarboxylase [Tissierellia bacterium]|nr:orotidine-5'-phosphate decarboxylase [Tissierellia bacterium]
MAKDVIIALDFPSREEVFSFLEPFEPPVFVKVGMELFYREGGSIVKELKERGYKVFLDLKLHDIPNTVKSAMANLLDYNPDMVDVHIAGGSHMIEEVSNLINKQEKKPILLGITMLTSTSEERMHKELKIDKSLSLEDTVLSYVEMGLEAGLTGIVCSPLEVPKLKEVFPNLVTVTPGIRMEIVEGDDQERVVTPKRARELGSDYIVVGRPITKAKNPVEAYEKIKKEFLEG